MFKKILDFCKTRWAKIISIIFIYIIPIILLNNKVALTKNVSAGIKITFAGICVLIVLFLIFRKKIYAKIILMPKSIKRSIFIIIHNGIAYGLVFGVLWTLSNFTNILLSWLMFSGIMWVCGAIFFIIDEQRR